MRIEVDIPDDRLLAFAKAYNDFLASGNGDVPEPEGKAVEEQPEGMMCAKDVAAVLGLASASTLYSNKRYALPPDDKAVKAGRTKYWPADMVMSHLRRCGLVDAEGRRTSRR